MDEVMNALRKIQKELNEQKTMIRDSAKDVTDQVTQNVNQLLEEKFCIWEQKHEKLKEIVENQEKRLYFLEKQDRQRNIVFFGVEEKELSYENLENDVIKWIDKYFSIKLVYSDIQEIKRIGKKSERPRPLIVTFSTLGIKIKIFKQKSALKDTQYYLKEDYPEYIFEKRKELQEQLRSEREKGNIAIIKYDKLIIIKNSYKRLYPASPENSSKPQTKNTQTFKKNKISNRRSSSISEGAVKQGVQNFVINKNAIITTTTQGSKDKCI